MDPKRLLVLVGSAALAIIAFVILVAMKPTPAPQVIVKAPTEQLAMTYVAVATHEMATGARISEQDLNWQAWPNSGLNRAWITNGPVPFSNQTGSTLSKMAGATLTAASAIKQSVVGMRGTPGAVLLDSVVRDPLHAGEPVLPSKLVKAGQAGIMAVRLDSGERAVSMPLTAENSVAGFVLPGDHVDVVLTRKANQAQGGGQAIATTILKNVKILAIDQSSSPTGRGEASLGSTATLQLSSDQAVVLEQARVQGDLTLVLRSYADTSGPAMSTVSAKAENLTPQVVHVFRNGVSTDVRVAQ